MIVTIAIVVAVLLLALLLLAAAHRSPVTELDESLTRAEARPAPQQRTAA